MHSQTASAPQFFDRVPGERVGKGVRASANEFLFSFLFAPFFLGFLFLFLFLILNLLWALRGIARSVFK